MPVTFWCMVIGLGALAGVPPLSGFWSKEGVLAAAEDALLGGGPAPAWVGWLVFLTGLVGVAVTAWYATRLLLRTFLGAARDPLATPHDPPGVLRWPVLLLAVPAALFGLAGFWPWFADRLLSTAAGELGAPRLVHVGPLMLLPLALLLLGAGLAWAGWRRDTAADPAAALGPLRPVFARAFRLDDVQHALVVRPTTALGRATRAVDERVVDGAVTGTGRGARALGGGLGALHRAALPRAAAALLAGVLLIGLATALIGATS